MRIIVGFFKLLLFCVLAAIVMAVLGFFTTVILEPFVIPGNDLHTDGYAKMGLALFGTVAGAALGVLGVIVWTIYNLLKKPAAPSEIHQ